MLYYVSGKIRAGDDYDVLRKFTNKQKALKYARKEYNIGAYLIEVSKRELLGNKIMLKGIWRNGKFRKF